MGTKAKGKAHPNTQEYPESEFVSKGHPCPDQIECRSSNAAALYADPTGREHIHCFSCGTTFPFGLDGDSSSGGAEGGARPGHQGSDPGEGVSSEIQSALSTGRCVQIKSRGLTAETCKRLDYRIRQNSRGEWEHMAVYRDRNSGACVGIKVRNTGTDGTQKDFYWIGSAKDNLWQAHRFPAGGKKITILEGEIDAATVDQAYAGKFPVVSLPNGAAEAEKCFKKNLEYISSFEQVVIGYDMDGPGRDAAVACAKLLPPGKAYIVKWSKKDANAMHTEGEADKVTWAVHTAEAYRPDGVIDARSLTADCLNPVVTGIPWPWGFMTDWTYGRRPEELYVIGAGTGIGKTDFIAEIIACTISGTTKDGHAPDYPPEGFAIFAYEAGAATTKKAIGGKLGARRFHIPQDDSGSSWTTEELRQVLDDMDHKHWDAGGKLFINDSKGAADFEAVVERMRYLHHAEGIKHFLVDPLSALSTEDDNQVQFIDSMVLRLAKLTVELQSNIYVASHLARPREGASHEEGGHVRLNQFRGSNAIGMFTNFVFGMERNQQAETEEERAVATIRVVKDRFTGNSIGKTSRIVYDAITGSYDVPLTKFLGDD